MLSRAQPVSETFAIAVLDGPVLKKTKKTAKNNMIHAHGNGVKTIPTVNGNARSIPIPETRKYEPEKRFRKRSPAIPPRIVEINPATTVIPPKMIRVEAVDVDIASIPGIQKARPPKAKVMAVCAIVFRR